MGKIFIEIGSQKKKATFLQSVPKSRNTPLSPRGTSVVLQAVAGWSQSNALLLEQEDVGNRNREKTVTTQSTVYRLEVNDSSTPAGGQQTTVGQIRKKEGGFSPPLGF